MKQIAFSFLMLLAFNSLKAQDLHDAGDINKNITPFHDVSDAMNANHHAYQQQAAWQQFAKLHPSWGASFDNYTHLPHRAFGSPIVWTGGGNDPVAKATDFLQHEFAGFNLPLNELVLTRNFNDGKFIHVDFKQVHNGVEVLWSRVGVRFTQNLDIVLVSLDAHRDIPVLSAGLSPASAIQKAEQAINTTILSSTIGNDLKLFPYPAEGKYDYRLAYAVHVKTINNNKTPGDYLTYVDANSGEILYRQNQTKFFDIKVKGDVYPTNQYTPTENRPLKNLKVVVGTTTYYSDATTGMLTFPSGPVNANISLEGKWVQVIDDAGGATSSAVYSHIFTASGDSSTFDITTPHANDRGVNVYYHVNAVHDFMKTKFPTFTVMDNPLPANVDVSGTCNAFYNGTSINFYAAGGGCNAFSYIGDVMSHEYGHGISDKFYTWQGGSFDNGAMGEGYSDTWANLILKTGVIGAGANSPTDFIRRYDIVHKIYPQDLVGEVHADGEIIAGAWWDVGVNWSSVDSMGDLFAKTYFGLATGPDGTEGVVYHDILIDALLYDDDNSNLNDGTPHFGYIVPAFAAHGIYLLTNTTILHEPPVTIAAGAPYTIDATAVADYPAFLGDLKMIYRLKGSTVSDTITMTKSGSNYTCQFPAATAGEVYEYIFALYDYTNALSVFSPNFSAFNTGVSVRNIPYFLCVGYNLIFNEPFDTITTATPGWTIGNYVTDNATAGKWIIANPIASMTNGDTVQTGRDHTTGTGKCAVTGNAASASVQPGSADVDGGRTSMVTQTYDLSGFTKPIIAYWRWYSNSQATTNGGKDYWRVYLSYDNGSTWTLTEKTNKPDVRWRRNVIIPDLTKGTSVKLLFMATDTVYTGVNGTWVEAAVDDIQILNIGIPSSMHDISALQTTIYPNPASHEVMVDLPDNGMLHYSIVNAVGETVLNANQTTTNNEAVINIASLANGVYFLKLEMNNKQSVHRLVVTK